MSVAEIPYVGPLPPSADPQLTYAELAGEDEAWEAANERRAEQRRAEEYRRENPERPR